MLRNGSDTGRCTRLGECMLEKCRGIEDPLRTAVLNHNDTSCLAPKEAAHRVDERFTIGDDKHVLVDVFAER